MNFNKYHVSRNLFDGTLIGGIFQDANFTVSGSTTVYKSIKIYLTAGNYTFSWVKNVNIVRLIIDGTYSENVAENVTNYTFTVNNDSYFGITFRDATSSSTVWDNSPIMLNEGSQPLPYEPYGDSWTNTPHYIHNTDTDTITTLPVDIYANDTTATVGLKGQAVQSGTPSPTTPIQPSECGERTRNLFDYQTMAVSLSGYYLNATGQEIALSGWRISDYVPCNGKEFTINKIGGNTPAICLYDENKQFLTGKSYQTGGTTNKIPVTISSDTNAKYIRFSYVTLSDNLTEIMITEGTTVPSAYILYGYKIPILCGNQTTNIYLGETQSTRAVKKLVLTGEENWEQQSGQTADYFRISNMAALPSKVFCTHFLSPDTDINYASTVTGIKMQQSSSYGVILACRPPNVTGLANFKSFLATQYANGTPVTVWYVLATPEITIINEPLMKIGDYADTLSGVSIPTVSGTNIIDVDTTLKPSEVQLEYKGWHPAIVHERTNGAWT